MKCNWITLLILTARNKPSSTDSQPAETIGVKPKSRKCFDNAELAASDTVFKASSGHPSKATMQRLSNSPGLEYDVVTLTFRSDFFYVVVII